MPEPCWVVGQVERWDRRFWELPERLSEVLSERWEVVVLARPSGRRCLHCRSFPFWEWGLILQPRMVRIYRWEALLHLQQELFRLLPRLLVFTLL